MCKNPVHMANRGTNGRVWHAMGELENGMSRTWKVKGTQCMMTHTSRGEGCVSVAHPWLHLCVVFVCKGRGHGGGRVEAGCNATVRCSSMTWTTGFRTRKEWDQVRDSVRWWEDRLCVPQINVRKRETSKSSSTKAGKDSDDLKARSLKIRFKSCIDPEGQV